MTELYSKYIANRQWQVKVDDGFGNRTKVLDLYHKIKDMPFYVDARLDIPDLDKAFGIKTSVTDSNTVLLAESSDEPDSVSTLPESYYLAIIPPHIFDNFIKFVNLIRKTCGVKIEGEFYSIHTDNKYDYPLYKLLFTLSPDTDNKPQYELSEGSWTPNFTSTKKRAGWIDMPEFYIEVDGKLVDGVKTLDSAIKVSTEESEKKLKDWKREHLKGTAADAVLTDVSQDLKEDK